MYLTSSSVPDERRHQKKRDPVSAGDMLYCWMKHIYRHDWSEYKQALAGGLERLFISIEHNMVTVPQNGKTHSQYMFGFLAA